MPTLEMTGLPRLREPAAFQVITPIHKLPVELLSQTFLLVVDSANNWLSQVLVISHVCAHWRRLACAIPRLWNRPLRLDLKRASSDTYLSTTKAFFERSAPLAIPVSLTNEVPQASSLLDFVFSLAPRWKSLVFRYSQVDRLHHLPVDSLENLEHLDVIAHMYSSPITVFLSAPRLRTVSLQVPDMNCVHMPWSQLTRITIWDFAHPAQDCLDVLAQCTNALSAVFTKVLPWSEPPIDRVVHLPQLERLRIIFAPDPYNHCITPFFTSLSLPALEDLSMQSRGSIEWSPSGFTDFQHRSPNIRQLRLSGVVRASEDVIRVLSQSPLIASLTVEGLYSSINPLLRVLQYSETSTGSGVRFAAALERLSLQEFHGAVDEGILTEMILSRWWTDEELRELDEPPPVACWKALEIRGIALQSYTKSFKGMVKLLRTEGLEVTL